METCTEIQSRREDFLFHKYGINDPEYVSLFSFMSGDLNSRLVFDQSGVTFDVTIFSCE